MSAAGFIKNIQEHFKQSRKETITNLLPISYHIWGHNLGWNTGPDFRHRSCKSLPLSNMAGEVAAITESPGR